MKVRAGLVALGALSSGVLMGQEVTVFGTTMAQMWKSEVPGFEQATYAPATQFLGIDATKLGSEGLSLHLFGWGRTDLKEASNFDGTKSNGYLSYGYVKYRFSQGNGELKAGRFTVSQPSGFEQVDGVSGRTDLRGGFTVSAFAGKPVMYKVVDPRNQEGYEFQHDLIAGTRLGWRGRLGELGVSYLMDGSKAAKDLDRPMPVDYTRRQLGLDMYVSPFAGFDLRGHTTWDQGSHAAVAPGAPEHKKLAESEYKASYRAGQVTVSAGVSERNFYAYYAGTNLPSLFKQDDRDSFKGWNLNVTWQTPWSVVAVADYKHTSRALYGDTNQAGGELRWANEAKSLMAGVSGHYVNAAKTLLVDETSPYKSLKHGVARGWAMAVKGKFTMSVDGILMRFSQNSPYTKGQRYLYEGVASLGYQAMEHVKVSGDVSYGKTAFAKGETRGLLRAEYRFGMSKKGGK